MRIIRIQEVKHKTGLGRSTIYRLVDSGEFPKQVSLAERSVGWIESEVEEWLESKIKNRQ